MDKKSKIFFIVFGLLIAGSVAVSYYKYMVLKDYAIVAQADCDPTSEKCFVHVCDPSPDADGDTCTGNLDDDTWYTKNISRMAYNIPDCDPNDETCTALICGDGEQNCAYTLCDETNVPEGDMCNDPNVYNLAHPAEDATDSGTTDTDIEGADATSVGSDTSSLDIPEDMTQEESNVPTSRGSTELAPL